MNSTRQARTLLLLAALALPLVGCASTSAQSPPQAAAAARVEGVPFESRLVGAALPYNVVLPPDYAAKSSARTRYPVLYLLHGLAGSANDWVSNRAHVADYAAQYRLIIVVPEGKDGWYTDGATVATDKFESYFVEELMPDVQKRFRTVEAREGRAVAGLSMGGYGALKFGLKYPERFAFAASMSGALDAASWLPEQSLAFVKPSIARVFGAADSPVRPANDIFRMARELSAARVAALPYFYLDCGTEDVLLPSSRDFAALLVERKIPHEYRQLPGNHGWAYWDGQVREVLKLAAQRLAPPQTRP
ncbi:MAG TPA: alpha/beta hydrolase family protein [Pyrinomonadaceae bacterium]|jgi:S-formylglutathione hydrolase FrmB|nr:alpha/beta hydrolase family protein [Pyrinomonadaceae bacterium]